MTTEPAGRVIVLERKDGIAKVQLPSGEIRYRVQLTVGYTPEGKRHQIMRSYELRKDAAAERDRVRHEMRTGVIVRPQDITCAALVAEFIETKAEKRASTVQNIKDALCHFLAAHGNDRAQAIVPADIAALKAAMKSGEARRRGRPGQPMSAVTINTALGKISAVFDYALREKYVATNPCANIEFVKPPTKKEQARNARKAWGPEEGAAFLRYVRETDAILYAPMVLTLLGLRRGEVLGLRWESVCLDGLRRPSLEDHRQIIAVGAPFIEIVENRTFVNGKIHDGDPKTDASVRALPLPPAVVVLLSEHREAQAERARALGDAWTCSDHVAVHVLGKPIGPDQYSDMWLAKGAAAGLPRVVLHGARNLTTQILHNSPEELREVAVKAWLGHARMGVTAGYSRTAPQSLAKAGQVLADGLGLV